MRPGPAAVNQAPNTAMPSATEIARRIRLPWRPLITPLSAVRAVANPPPAPEGPGRPRPAPGAAGAGVTTGNNLARLPPWLGANSAVTIPRGNAIGRASGPVTLRIPAELLPLCPGAAGLLCDGDGDGLGEGDGLGQAGWFGPPGLGVPVGPGVATGPGEGVPLGHGDLLGEGEGLGDGDLDGDGLGDGDLLGDGDGLGDDVLGEGLGAGDDLLGDGDGAALVLLGEGDGDPAAAAPVPGRTASRIPTAIAPPPAMARAPARGQADTSPL